MRAVAIIGMNFGDEGKGHIADFLSDKDTLNIRFNGGAQAAHAVFLSDGRNHIFRQFGSGSLQEARTLFASHFIINPIFFAAEWQELSKKTSLREVFVDPRCRVTTIWDMLINGFSSFYRKKNDTTGVGINETIERSRFRQLRISVRDLIDKDKKTLVDILKTIRREYVPWRLEKLSLPYPEFRSYSKQMIKEIKQAEESFMDTIEGLLQCIVVWPDGNLVDRYLDKDKGRKIVFEGAQGLRLDQNRKELMPYLTRSNTGLQNVFDCLRKAKTPLELDCYLVTRAYLTRHGDGPIWNEIEQPYDGVEETTNTENSFQGRMRYGYLNKTWYDMAIKEMKEYINLHLPKCVSKVNLFTAFTCLDQVDGSLIYSMDGSKDFVTSSIEDFENVKIISKGNKETDCCYINH